ncbi:MAG: glycosyltransferase [Planctomycetota bacterium]
MSKTRVVLLIPTLDRSGAEKQFTLLATRLPREEFDVRAIALTRGGPYEAEFHAAGVPLTVIGKRAKFDPFSFWRLRDELRRHDPDILHTWLFAANAYGRLCAHAIPRAKIVVSERCIDSWKSGWQLWLDRRLISRTDRLVGNSPSVVEFYRELGVPPEKLVCIPNGIECGVRSAECGVKTRDSIGEWMPPEDSSFVTPHSALRAPRSPSLLAELNLPPDAFLAGFIGRLAKQKRVEDLIWAVETLRQIRPRLQLVVIGDGPERERLEQFTRDVHCTGHVRFLGHREDAARILPAFDVLCLASSFEGMSNSVMEAMAAGLPVLASDIPPNRELVVPGETGFLFKLADSVGVMQFLRRLIDEPGLGERLGRAGRERIQREFSIERMVDGYANVYRQLMGR